MRCSYDRFIVMGGLIESIQLNMNLEGSVFIFFLNHIIWHTLGEAILIWRLEAWISRSTSPFWLGLGRSLELSSFGAIRWLASSCCSWVEWVVIVRACRRERFIQTSGLDGRSFNVSNDQVKGPMIQIEDWVKEWLLLLLSIDDEEWGSVWRNYRNGTVPNNWVCGCVSRSCETVKCLQVWLCVLVWKRAIWFRPAIIIIIINSHLPSHCVCMVWYSVFIKPTPTHSHSTSQREFQFVCGMWVFTMWNPRPTCI